MCPWDAVRTEAPLPDAGLAARMEAGHFSGSKLCWLDLSELPRYCSH